MSREELEKVNVHSVWAILQSGIIQAYHLIYAVERNLMLNFLKKNCSALSHKDDTPVLNVINLQNVMHKNGEREKYS